MRSRLRELWPELALVAFVGLNTVALLTTTIGQTVPFHFIWISLTVVYGYRAWTMSWTFLALAVVCVVTAASLVFAVTTDALDPAELTEVPLMAGVFLANILHARRREAALEQVRQYAAEQERQRGNERDFLRDASHLLRTPVTIARGYTELLQSGLDDPALMGDADVVLRELDSITRISSRLLLLTNTDLRELLDPRESDIADLLEQAVLRWQPTADRHWEVQAEECEVLADATLLESALDALVENAVRHTGTGDRILLGCHLEGSAVVVVVSDEGEGLSEQLLPSLFERKWSPSSPGERGGSGLGLAIVKAIVTAHGGEVGAGHSPSGGAEFVLRLPAMRVAAVSPELPGRGPLATPPPPPALQPTR